MHEFIERMDMAYPTLELLVRSFYPAHKSIDMCRRQSIPGAECALHTLSANWFSDDAGVMLQDDDRHSV